MNKPLVCLEHCQDLTGTPVEYDRGDIERLSEHIGRIFDCFPEFRARLQGARVLIKPNLVRPDPARVPAMTTDPRVLRALVRTCLELQVERVFLGEKPGYCFPARQAFDLIGLTKDTLDDRVSFSYFDEEDWQRVPNPGADLFHEPLIPERALDCDLIINVPKMKTHMHAQVSLGLKNFQGLVNDDERMLFHRNDLSHKIVDTVLACKPDFTLVDGLWPMEGQAPLSGDTVPDFNLLVGGENVVAVDSVCCTVMGISPIEVTHLRLAHQKNLGPIDLDEIRLQGAPLEAVTRRFKRPVLSSVGVFPNIHVIEGGACAGCLSAIRHSLDKCQFEKIISRLEPMTLFVGRSMPNRTTLRDWQGNLWLFGNCAQEILFPDRERRTGAVIIPGCPPHVLDLFSELKRRNNL
ncbi:DUF362 domain-containing protein [bacterium]|nr:DUF362 domain-containing protein [bacterium]